MSLLLSNLKREFVRSKPFVESLLCLEPLKIITVVPGRSKYTHNRHRDPKYRLERTRKMWPIDLPDFDHMRKEKTDMGPDEVRSKLKEKGVAPPSPWNEREMYMPSTIAIMDPYKPSVGEGKSSSLLDKVKSPFSSGKAYIKDRRETSTIRSFEGEDFDLEDFAKQTTNIYVKAHEALAAKDEEKIFDYVTEHCFPLMTAGLNKHTIVWKYLGDIAPPEVVQVRSGDLISKGNKYSQITVKMHTKQMLAIYDRHGRLAHGSPVDVKDVLEYVVFEKYLANEYGLWRIHGRIRPDEDKHISQQVSKTFVDREGNKVC